MKRIWLWFQIRALEATIYGREEVMLLVNDRMTLANMDFAQLVAHAELRRLKQEYAR
jgi:hypothetical protein